jgi:type VI secretion system protein VasJ
MSRISAASGADNDILALEPEALEKADTDGLDAALHWLQTRPGTDATKDKWLLRLLMARVAEQKGKNELALICWENSTVRQDQSPSRSGHRRCCLK